MLARLALALLAPAARAGDGEAPHNLRGAAVDRPPARVVRARRDARTFVTPDAAGPVPNAAPHANADLPAVRIVRRRPDVVLRDEGLQHMRLRHREAEAR